MKIMKIIFPKPHNKSSQIFLVSEKKADAWRILPSSQSPSIKVICISYNAYCTGARVRYYIIAKNKCVIKSQSSIWTTAIVLKILRL